MPERRSLRSNKTDTTSSSTNGEKARSNSQSSSSNKDKPHPARSTSSRSKSFSNRKGLNSATKDTTNGDQPHLNGSEPIENGIDSVDEPELNDQQHTSAALKKSDKDKDGDEEMTVVVPPSKAFKNSDDLKKDEEGDTAMNGTLDPESKVFDDVVDPQAKAVDGTLFSASDTVWSMFNPQFVLTCEQLSKPILASSRELFHSSTLASRSEYFDRSRPSVSIYPPMSSLESSRTPTRLLVPLRKIVSKL